MKRVVIVDGTRTPFVKSGTSYFDLMAYQLGEVAIKGLLKKTGIDPKIIDTVIMGTVISQSRTSNVARESSLGAGIMFETPCSTVTMACISANQAIASGVEKIMTGQADIVIAGGTDSTSDTPIQFKKEMRKKLFLAQKLKTPLEFAKFAFTLRPGDFAPDRPAVSEFKTGRTMGLDCDIMAKKFGIARNDQDVFALRSHQLAAKAEKEGIFDNEITPVEINGKKITKDNGIKGDAKIEKLTSLKPAFVKEEKGGTLTAANSSFLTDGASAVLLMSEEKAKELGLKPLAYIHSYAFTGCDINDELLLGIAYSVAKVLKRANLTLADMDAIEFHEAFAGAVLTNTKCLADENFSKTKLGYDKAVGTVNVDKMNIHGGSLAIGHPFGATGGRLITTLANRLVREEGRYGILSACAAGGHGHAMILERYAK
jgi:acetyl-CoA acyltransferase